MTPSYGPSAAPDEPDTILAAVVDPDQLAAWTAAATAVEDLNVARIIAAQALGRAARALGMSLDEVLVAIDVHAARSHHLTEQCKPIAFADAGGAL